MHRYGYGIVWGATSLKLKVFTEAGEMADFLGPTRGGQYSRGATDPNTGLT